MEITTKKGLEKEWEGVVAKNFDGYGRAVIRVVRDVCSELDKGKTPQEAEKIGIRGEGITGFQAGVMAQMISRFHPRGEEFKTYFNSQFSDKPQKGVINPAIIKMSSWRWFCLRAKNLFRGKSLFKDLKD